MPLTMHSLHDASLHAIFQEREGERDPEGERDRERGREREREGGL